MDLSEQKKPSLPRLSTNIPAESQSSPSLPLLPKKSQDRNVKPKPARPVNIPSPYPDRENIAPSLQYVPEPKGLYMTDDFGDPAIIKKKTKYYEEVFATRGSPNSPQERVIQDSVIVIELETNYKIKGEQPRLVSDLVVRLAQIYQRPESCIMLTIVQDARVCFGNATEISYLLKVYALPAFIGPFTNLRNTNLIQVTMAELMNIPMSQGVIIFIPIPEDNLATNGSTARGEISRLERHDQDDNPNIFKTISRSMSRRLKSSSGQSAPISLPSTVGTATTSPSTKTEIHHSPINMGDLLESPQEEKERSLRKHKSLRSIVRRRFNEIIPQRERNEKETSKETVKDTKSKEENDGEIKENLDAKVEDLSSKEAKRL